MTKLQRIERQASRLSRGEMRRLIEFLQATIIMHDEELKEAQKPSAHEIVDVKERNGVTYKLEYVRCGKKNCKCVSGSLHGPYWYKYWKENGRARSSYIGKKLPASVNGHTTQNSHAKAPSKHR